MSRTIHTLLTMMIVSGLVFIVFARRFRRSQFTLRALIASLVGLNGLAVLVCLGAVFFLGNPMTVLAQGASAPSAEVSGAALGAALATGLACIGAGIAVGIAGAAAIGGITEKPEILGRTLIFVGLAEGIAIYGLIISFMILNR